MAATQAFREALSALVLVFVARSCLSGAWDVVQNDAGLAWSQAFSQRDPARAAETLRHMTSDAQRAWFESELHVAELSLVLGTYASARVLLLLTRSTLLSAAALVLALCLVVARGTRVTLAPVLGSEAAADLALQLRDSALFNARGVAHYSLVVLFYFLVCLCVVYAPLRLMWGIWNSLRFWFSLHFPRTARTAAPYIVPRQDRPMDQLGPRFSRLHNFRPLVPSGKLYRSATLELVSDADAKLLAGSIRTVIDLRGTHERADVDDPAHPLHVHAPGLRRVHVPFVNKTTSRVLAMRAGVLPIALYLVGSAASKTISGKLPVFAERVLVLPYTAVLLARTWFGDNGRVAGRTYMLWCKHSRGEVLRCLQLIADSDTHPVLFHCVSGKDRTGVLAACVLSAIGVPRADIVRDYALSDEFGLSETHIRQVLPGPIGGAVDSKWANDEDVRCLLGAPPHVMEHFFEEMDREFGSMDAYFDEIGFAAEDREALRAKLQ